MWQPRVDNAKAKTGAERGGRDYQALLARADIDGVVIVVPDHLHYPIARAALLAGKDVYLEKPMTYTIDEAAKLHDLVQQTGRMLQVGGSGLNSPLHQKLHAYVESGKMGKVVWGLISYNRNTTEGMWDYPIPGIGSTPWPDAPVTAENLDWKAWLGDAPKRPFSKERYFRWRKFWDYSGGNATDLLFHRLGALSAIVGFDFPSRVVGAGGIYVQKNRQVPDTYMTTVEYPKEYCFNMVSCMANADSAPITVYGNWGTLQVLPNVRQPGQPAGPPTARAVIRAERQFLAKFKEANEGREEVEITTDRTGRGPGRQLAEQHAQPADADLRRAQGVPGDRRHPTRRPVLQGRAGAGVRPEDAPYPDPPAGAPGVPAAGKLGNASNRRIMDVSPLPLPASR